ncbi:MAG: amino acid carrier protein, partial [Cryomorphaceae bacterium]
MKYILTGILSLVIFTGLQAQLNAVLEVANDSETIDDGRAKVVVTGGEKPYSYKWSNQETPLTSATTTGLTEGLSFSVIVTDAQGEQATIEGYIPPESSEEKINSVFLPIVGALETVLFWDPFET